MAKQKNTIIYHSHFELMDGLSDEQAGKLIKAIGKFNSDLDVSIDDPLVMGMFTAIKRDFILQSENYEKKVKANRENGSKGGRPKNPTITQDNPQNLKDKDKEKDKEKDIIKTVEVEAYKASRVNTDKPFIESFFEQRNELPSSSDIRNYLNS